jgi:hypothetical protein
MNTLKEDDEGRGIGLWLISLYWLARASGVFYAVHIAYANSSIASKVMPYIEFCGPFLWIIRPKPEWGLSIAPLFALLDIVIGIGLLFYQRWALTLAMLDRIIPAIEFIVLLPVGYGLLGGKEMNGIVNPSPLKTADILISLFMAMYLLSSGVRRKFGIK